jgi:hypothetical protein
MKQEKKILIGVAGFVLVFFLLRHIGRDNAGNMNQSSVSKKKVTVVKYNPVIKPAYVQSHYVGF